MTIKNRNAYLSGAWAVRDMSVQARFDKIDRYLKERGKFLRTHRYDELVSQWLEYAKLSEKQIRFLDEIIERRKIR